MAKSTTEGAGSVTTKNLILYLDANNPRSYPGSGTTWYDLSGNQNNFILYNSPTFTGNSFIFNGTNQYSAASTNTFGNFGSSSFTIEHIVDVVTAGGQSAVIMKRAQSTNVGLQNNPGICDRTGINQFFVQDDNAGNITSGDVTHVVYLSSIGVAPTKAHVVYTIERNGTQATGSRYINGVLTNTDKKNFVGNNSIDNNSTMQLMLGSGQYVSGSLYTVRIYNTLLSANEVRQNFLATKTRYSL